VQCQWRAYVCVSAGPCFAFFIAANSAAPFTRLPSEVIITGVHPPISHRSSVGRKTRTTLTISAAAASSTWPATISFSSSLGEPGSSESDKDRPYPRHSGAMFRQPCARVQSAKVVLSPSVSTWNRLLRSHPNRFRYLHRRHRHARAGYQNCCKRNI
jgi:hypothetical protein